MCHLQELERQEKSSACKVQQSAVRGMASRSSSRRVKVMKTGVGSEECGILKAAGGGGVGFHG